MWGPTQKFFPTSLDVLTFIEYKQTGAQTDKQSIYIYIEEKQGELGFT